MGTFLKSTTVAFAAMAAIATSQPVEAGALGAVIKGAKTVVVCARKPACRAEVIDAVKALGKKLADKAGVAYDTLTSMFDDKTVSKDDVAAINERLDKIEARLIELGIFTAEVRKEFEMLRARLDGKPMS